MDYETRFQFASVLEELSLYEGFDFNQFCDYDERKASENGKSLPSSSHSSQHEEEVSTHQPQTTNDGNTENHQSPNQQLQDELKTKVVSFPETTKTKTPTSLAAQGYGLISEKTLHETIQSLRPVFRRRDVALYNSVVPRSKATNQRPVHNLKRCHLTVKCATAATFPRRKELDGALISRAELEMAKKLLKPFPAAGDEMEENSFEDKKSLYIDLKPGLQISKAEFDSVISNLRKVGDTKSGVFKKCFYQDIGAAPVDDVATEGAARLEADVVPEAETGEVKTEKRKRRSFLSRLKFWKKSGSTSSKTHQQIESPDSGKEDKKETGNKSWFFFLCCCARRN